MLHFQMLDEAIKVETQGMNYNIYNTWHNTMYICFIVPEPVHVHVISCTCMGTSCTKYATYYLSCRKDTEI